MEKSITEKKWETFLHIAIQDFRTKFPQDSRDDYQLLESLHRYFYKTGLIKKDKKTGKYIIPDIVNWNSENNPFFS